MNVVVTGASGFLGGLIARALVSRGHLVTSVGRTDPGIAGITHVDWDLTGPAPAAIRSLAERRPAVVHAAALTPRVPGTPEPAPESFHAVNVTGTRAVVDAFAASRLIHLSTTAVYDPQVPHEELFEEAGPVEQVRYLSPYQASKAQAEAVISRVHRDSLILRPAPVYAPWDHSDPYLVPFIGAHTHKDVLALPGGGREPVSLCAPENLVSAVLAGLEHPEVTGPVNVADPSAYLPEHVVNPLMARAGLEPVKVDAQPADLARVKARAAQRGLAWGKRAHRWPLPAVVWITASRTYELTRLGRLLFVDPVDGLSAALD
ncbi:NAD(P)-dependent oxidoreductase [Brevibacterium sp. 91QC2O2]|uniref:NAD-dependent epimerase/dehydratase family protein n=1 Tax=Brevibacterium sp. 91QC2O2 TaxID=2968458 RepID=UPI00211C7538|nr:NAD(P)-dependent oxidoreductase [Brevibacterium sp. 91QC2O2]MCQ9368039.1 NAD(P)-dependent oxidoreductase [Brevibacterium sp. 91QC2O2]